MKRKRCPTCGRLENRSTQANARYWLLLHLIADNITPEGKSYSAETWHTYWKSRLLGCEEFTMPNGKTMQIPKSWGTGRRVTQWLKRCAPSLAMPFGARP